MSISSLDNTKTHCDSNGSLKTMTQKLVVTLTLALAKITRSKNHRIIQTLHVLKKKVKTPERYILRLKMS